MFVDGSIGHGDAGLANDSASVQPNDGTGTTVNGMLTLT